MPSPMRIKSLQHTLPIPHSNTLTQFKFKYHHTLSLLNMQFKLLTLTTLALATTFAAATPAPRQEDGQCTTGTLQCCNTTTTTTDPLISVILSLLGIVLPDLDAIIGINCSPLSVIGVGGSACQANPVCCDDSSVGGLISVGCVPVNL